MSSLPPRPRGGHSPFFPSSHLSYKWREQGRQATIFRAQPSTLVLEDPALPACKCMSAHQPAYFQAGRWRDAAGESSPLRKIILGDKIPELSWTLHDRSAHQLWCGLRQWHVASALLPTRSRFWAATCRSSEPLQWAFQSCCRQVV